MANIKIFNGFLNFIANLVIKFPKLTVISWFIFLLIAIPGVMQLGETLEGGNGTLESSDALKVDQYLKEKFDFAFAEGYVVTFSSQTLTVDEPAFKKNLQVMKEALERLPDTIAVIGFHDIKDKSMLSDDRKKTFLTVGQQSGEHKVLEKRVPFIRKVVEDTTRILHQNDPSLKVFMTGSYAIDYDIHQRASKSTEEAEKKVFALTLIVLLIAFGSVTAAILPLFMALFSNIIGLALIVVMGHSIPISVYAQSIASMIGLGVGIDYSLLMVWRFREEIKKQDTLEQAIKVTIIQAGSAIFFSGFCVIIGLSGLLFAEMMPLYSIGIGGVIVVMMSIILSLTFVPAVMYLLGSKINYPETLNTFVARFKPSTFWEKTSRAIMKKPLLSFLLALLAIAILALPALRISIQDVDVKSLPDDLPAKEGIHTLEQMSNSGIILPIKILVKTRDGSSILTREYLESLQSLYQYLKNNQSIASVYGLPQFFEEQQGDAITTFLNQLAFMQIISPQIFQQFLSQDQSVALIQAIPVNLDNYADIIQFCQHLRDHETSILRNQELTFLVGGPPGMSLDYSHAVSKNLGFIVLGVMLVTYLALFAALRSILLPLKAILLNLMSVAVSYGVLVLVFQEGLLPGIPPGPIIIFIPILLFCIVFGLSIDYEVFLMTRIKEEYERGANNEEATITGIRYTGDVITYAALIMCIVFGAFATVNINVIRQLGFGLGVAIFVDATLIRMLMVPAFMKFAGKWNWYPGGRKE